MKIHQRYDKYQGPKQIQSNRPEAITAYILPRMFAGVARWICYITAGKEKWTDVSSLVSRVQEVYKTNGVTFTVKYLKVCYMMTVTRLSRVSPSLYVSGPGEPIVGCTKEGYPRIIPLRFRPAFADPENPENRGVIKCILSVFSLYRVIKIPPKLKLNTITDPFTGTNLSFERDVIRRGLVRLCGPNITKTPVLTWQFAHSSSSGPNAKVATIGIWIDAIALCKEYKILYHWFRFTKVISNRWTLVCLFLYCASIAFITKPIWWAKSRITIYTGRLLTKDEPAGKVRVLAVSDWWTQNAFKPLHKYLFSLLKKLPTDGTMDQNACLKRLMELNQSSNYCASFDLSAATDRLPVVLQKDILSILFDGDSAHWWHKLMVDRSWDFKREKLRYSVGQPIGAYSSWAILALTHHVIVQISAEIAGSVLEGDRFEKYGVLGDDIVIFDKDTADQYLILMKQLGVSINISKSVISDGTKVFEFAKRIVKGSSDLSPIGAKAALISFLYPDISSVALVDAVQKSSITQETSLERLCIMVEDGLIKGKDMCRTYSGLFGPGGIASSELSSIIVMNDEHKLEDVSPSYILTRRTTALRDAVINRLKCIQHEVRTKKWVYPDNYWGNLGDKGKSIIESQVWENPIDFWVKDLGWWEKACLEILHPATWWWTSRVNSLIEEVGDGNWSFSVIPKRPGFGKLTYAQRVQYHKELIQFDFGRYNVTFAASNIEKLKSSTSSIGSLVYEAQTILYKETAGHSHLNPHDYDWGFISYQYWKSLGMSRSDMIHYHDQSSLFP